MDPFGVLVVPIRIRKHTFGSVLWVAILAVFAAHVRLSVVNYEEDHTLTYSYVCALWCILVCLLLRLCEMMGCMLPVVLYSQSLPAIYVVGNVVTALGTGAFSALPSVYLTPRPDGSSVCSQTAATMASNGISVSCPLSEVESGCAPSYSSAFVAGGASFAFAVGSDEELSTSTLEVLRNPPLFISLLCHPP